jgi:protein-L-isoaspartate(D-aspartate) O-methyltransferase
VSRHAVQRERMVEQQLSGIVDPAVRRALASVPRHAFIPAALDAQAYADRPLPIGQRQTISQPWIVARMSELLGLSGTEKVLEIGTGSGYQTAVLAQLCSRVISLERVGELASSARRRLSDLRLNNVTVLQADGTLGRSEYAPFDAILVTAGAPDVPRPLLGQLADGGRLVLPVGDADVQTLVRVTRRGDAFEREEFEGCRFVPLIGRFGWNA